MATIHPPLTPRIPGPLRILIQTRISGDKNQDELSLEDQRKRCEDYIASIYDGPVEIRVNSEIAKGEDLLRTGFLRLCDDLKSWKPDVVIAEDGSRVCRRMHLFMFCEECEDLGVRFLTVGNDRIDTAQPNWRLAAVFSGMHHEQSNKDTSERIIRTLRNRFVDGKIVMTLPWGYEKPHAGCTADEIIVLPEAPKVYDQCFTILDEGGTFAEVADWLNANEIPTGDWCRLKTWDPRMVARVVYNPILKGCRRRNDRKAKRINGTGKRITIKAEAKERLTDHRPHLAVIDAERYDRVVAKVKRRNANKGRKSKDDPDSRARKFARWPGGLAKCGICGRNMVWGGHGDSRSMMCTGVRAYSCWMAADMIGLRAVTKVLEAIVERLETLPDWPQELLQQVLAERDRADSDRAELLQQIEDQEAQLQKESDNVVTALAAVPDNPLLLAKIATLAAQLEDLKQRRMAVPPAPKSDIEIPSIESLVALAKELVGSIDMESKTWARKMSELVSEFYVLPVRSIDGGRVQLRAQVAVDFACLAGAPWLRGSGLLGVERFTVDLFDPPGRISLMPEILRLRREGVQQREVAKQLGTHQATVQRAEKLARMMAEQGLTSPYEPIVEPPNDARFRKHKNARYRFDPLPGFGDGTLPTKDAA